jgi:hypothetical protein
MDILFIVVLVLIGFTRICFAAAIPTIIIIILLGLAFKLWKLRWLAKLLSLIVFILAVVYVYSGLAIATFKAITCFFFY